MIQTFIHDHFCYSVATSKIINKKKELKDRQDVINKALLRSLKRFYLEEFRSDNKYIMKKRYKQVPGEMVLNGFTKTCRRLFGDIPNINEISQFVMIISWIKPVDKYPFIEQILTKGERICKVMCKYSYAKLQELFDIQEFEFVFRFIYDNHRERIFKLCTKKQVDNKEAYSQMLDSWIDKFAQNHI